MMRRKAEMGIVHVFIGKQ